MPNFHLLFTMSLFIYGLNFATDFSEGDEWKQNGYKNLLWRLRFYSLKYIGEYWTRPLFSCVICMASVWGTLFYLLSYYGHYNALEWLITTVSLAGLNRVLRNFV